MKVEPGFTGEFPAKHTCDGEDLSPSVRIENVPGDAEAVALVLDDPDAPSGTFYHWLIWNISPGTDLESGIPTTESVLNGAVQGRNDFGRIGYSGPCPPAETHKYRFNVYALESELELEPGAGVSKLERALQRTVIAQATAERYYTR